MTQVTELLEEYERDREGALLVVRVTAERAEVLAGHMALHNGQIEVAAEGIENLTLIADLLRKAANTVDKLGR